MVYHDGSKYVNAPTSVAVPAAVVTVTFFAPAVPLGVTAVTVVSFTTTKIVELFDPPTCTLLVPVRFVPVIVIGVPPLVDPVLGLTAEIVGSETWHGP